MMLVHDGKDIRPMGLAEDGEFYRLFGPLREGLQLLANAKLRGETAPDHQLRLLQHGPLQSLQGSDPEFRVCSL